jgi:hypothetical protein
MHVTQNEFAIVAKMFAIHLALVLINIIGEGDAPARPFQTDAHQPDTGEKFRKCPFGYTIHSYAILFTSTACCAQFGFDATRNQV